MSKFIGEIGIGPICPSQTMNKKAAISDYDRFVAFCTNEFNRDQTDEALRYFDNRFYNRRVDNQTGHLRQAFYASKEFLSRFPDAKKIRKDIAVQGRLETKDWPYLDEWKSFVANHNRITLPEGGDMETVYRILPVSLGGRVRGGGGAGPSFKVVLPLVARYLSEGAGLVGSLAPVGADVWEDMKGDAVRPSRRTSFMTSRVIRDSRKSLALKTLYEHRCQVCRRRIEIRRGDFYSEAHHLRPLGGRHAGPDSRSNMLVLCPWHHAEFDHFLFRIEPRRRLSHRLRRVASTESKIILQRGHRLGEDFINYNNTYFAKLAAGK